jgi:hypothetical protein
VSGRAGPALGKRPFTREHPCPICGGHDGARRGAGERCWGYLDSTGGYARCTREEHAGDLEQNGDGTFSHRLEGPCRCGVEHAPAPADQAEVRHAIRDVDGRLLAVHVRKGRGSDKRVWWEGPDGRPGLRGAAGSPRDWLYGAERLPALAPGSHVLLVEGERAADALIRRGVAAVGTVTGAGTAHAPHAISPAAAQLLAGFAVVGWPDNDEPGRAHMRACGAVLERCGIGFALIDWPDAPERGDADDWHGTDDDLVALIVGARPVEAPPAPAPAAAAPRTGAPPPLLPEADPVIPDGFLTEWCETMSAGTEAPPAAYLSTGLAVLATLVGARLHVRWSHTRIERCNVWVLTVGRSALGRKTTGMHAAKWAIRIGAEVLGDGVRWFAPKRLSDAGLAARLDVVSADTAAAQEIADAEAAAAPGRGGQRAKAAAVAPVTRAVPVSWLLAINEVAPLWGEGLREWQAAASAMLLDLFDGELASDTRATEVPEQETFVCALGNIPPAELVERTTLRLLTSGFAGRWIIVPSPGPREGIPFPSLNGRGPQAALGEYVRHLARLAADARGPDGRGLDILPLWTAEAREAREGWYMERFARLASLSGASREDAAAADLWSRLQATAAKLATLVAVSRRFAAIERLEDVRVDAGDVGWAQGLVDASIATLLGVVREAGGGASTPIGRVENRVLAYLRAAGADDESRAVSRSRVAAAVKNSDTYGDVMRALDDLLAIGRVAEVGGVSGPRGGRPARVVWIIDE